VRSERSLGCPYCGPVPRVDQSVDGAIYGHITKAGPSLLRFFLVNAVHTTVRGSHTFRMPYMNLNMWIGDKKAILAMARKPSVVIYNMLVKDQDFVEMQAFKNLHERKLRSMEMTANKVQQLEKNYVTGLIRKEVLRFQSNEILS
jgi:hypothetical protein